MFKSYFLKKLNESYPDLSSRYDFSAVPDSFNWSTKLKVLCPQHGEFTRIAGKMIHGQGCLLCEWERGERSIVNSTSSFIERSMKRYGQKFDYNKAHYSHNNNAKITLLCNKHGEIQVTSKAHFNGNTGCPKCDGELMLDWKLERTLDKAKKVHGDKYDYSKVVYKNDTEKVEIVCPEHGSFWQDMYCHVIKKTNCPKCVILGGRLTHDAFISKAKKVHGDKYFYCKTSYETIAGMVTITCPKHGDFIQRAGSHLQGNGCINCFRESTILPTNVFIDNAKKYHGDKYDYSKVVYKNSKTKVEIVCPEHGSFWQRPNGHVGSRAGCPTCIESKGEIAVRVVLDKYDIDYIREYRIPPYLFRYDFYLPQLNVYIEYHGQQHYRPIDIFGGNEAFRLQKERDVAKKKLVRDSNGILLVLNYLTITPQAIEKELIRKLNKIYLHRFICNSEIKVFRSSLDVYRHYQIDSKVFSRDLEKEVVRKFPSTKVLAWEPNAFKHRQVTIF